MRAGDREAFAQIYRLHIAGLIRYGYRVTSSQQLIRDSIHDLFLYLWLHRESISGTDSIRFYLFRSLRNRILQQKKGEKLVLTAPEDFTMPGALFEPSCEEALIGAEWELENTIRLRKAIDRLSKRQQEVIQLRYFHNFNAEEIARLMQISNQSVRNLLHRTLLELRRVFELAGKLVLLVWAA